MCFRKFEKILSEELLCSTYTDSRFRCDGTYSKTLISLLKIPYEIKLDSRECISRSSLTFVLKFRRSM